MYESSMEIAKKYLFFRPFAEGDPDVLLSGNVNVNKAGDVKFDTSSGHLVIVSPSHQTSKLLIS